MSSEKDCKDIWFYTAQGLVKDVGKSVKEAFYKVKKVETKSSPRDLVTETDKAVEAHLITTLKNAFPSHKFIGEESQTGHNELTDDPTWIIDPIDGTMNFVHAFPYTCISVGLWINKQPEIGIVYNAILDQMFTARKGQGAFMNGDRIHVSGQTDLKKSLIFTEMGSRADPKKMEVIYNNIRAIMKEAHGIRSMGSAALNMCHVAMGGIDGYYEIGIHAWDMAAGCLLVTEAGGYVCDVNGGTLNIFGRRILCAASKEIADQLQKILEYYDEVHD